MYSFTVLKANEYIKESNWNKGKRKIYSFTVLKVRYKDFILFVVTKLF